jgi:hypothetical protein
VRSILNCGLSAIFMIVLHHAKKRFIG